MIPQAGSLFSYDDAGRLTRTHANPGPQKLRVPAGESLSGLFFVVVTLGETSGRCFAVETRQVVAGFVHHLHDLVETDHMRTVGERGVGVGVEGSGRGDCASSILNRLYQMEENAMHKLGEEKRKQLIESNTKYYELLKEEIENG